MSSQCPRCGRIGAAEGHTLYGDWLDCVENYELARSVEKNLTIWAKDWQNEAGQNRLEVLNG